MLVHGADAIPEISIKPVNMTTVELWKWLRSSDLQESGGSKSDGSGESIGHER